MLKLVSLVSFYLLTVTTGKFKTWLVLYWTMMVLRHANLEAGGPGCF